MTLMECINAYSAILELERKEQPFKLAYGMMTVKKALQPHVTFFAEKEMKLVKEYAVLGADGRPELTAEGGFRFRDPTRAGEYAVRRTEIGSVEVNEELPCLTVPAPLQIQPVHLEALQGLLIFEDGGADNE